MKDVTLDRKKLMSLAKLFDHREMWSYVTSLQSLAWGGSRRRCRPWSTSHPNS